MSGTNAVNLINANTISNTCATSSRANADLIKPKKNSKLDFFNLLKVADMKVIMKKSRREENNNNNNVILHGF